jgi:hypothetical protein
MDQLVEVLKYVSALLAVLAPLLKLFPGFTAKRPQELEEQYKRVKTFFDEGGAERHPLLVEMSFAAAVGHRKLNAVEIPLLLRQKKPSQFIDAYASVRDYLAPTKNGERFELRSIAAKDWLRKLLVAVGVALYAVFAVAVLWLLFYQAPKLALSQSWAALLAVISCALLFIAAAAYCLVAGSRLHWAKQLEASQR